MKHLSLSPALIWLLLWLGLAEAAAQRQVAGRPAEWVEPIVTEEALPNEVGEWDLRVSCVYERLTGGTRRDCVRTQLFFGIARRWGAELEASFPSSFGSGEGEPGAEISTTLKYLLRAPERGPAVALAMEMAFAAARPAGSEQGRIELQPALALLQPLGRATLQGNIGYAIAPANGGGESRRTLVYNASLAFCLRRRKWHAFAEVTGASGREESGLAFSPGLKYSFGSGHFLALGLPVGLTSHSPAIGVILQLQLSLARTREAAGSESQP